MKVKITSKRQVTFPAHVLDALGVKPGDRLELREGPVGYLLVPVRLEKERLAPLRSKLPADTISFDLKRFREQPHDVSLRD